MGKRGLPKLANSAKQAVAAAKEDALLETRDALPADPEDARLTLDGAVVDAKGKINVGAYEDLQSWYAGEPPPDKHPHPKYPGVQKNEEVLKGMRMWDDLRAGAKDKDGAGWIAARSRKNEPKIEKWFNIRTTGSWRLAFLLARLQLQLWDRRGGPGFNQRAQPAAESAEQGSSSAAASGDAQAEDSLDVLPPDASTPQKAARAGAKPQQDAPAPASAKKRPRAPARSPGKVAVPRQQEPSAEAKKPTIGVDALAGSVRLQQILAARRAQEEAAAAAAAAVATPSS